MGNRIQIRHGSSAHSSIDLLPYELGLLDSNNSQILYIGMPSGTPISLGGTGAYLPLTGGTMTGSITLSNGAVLNGHATSATNDGDGNTISSTYLKASGGQMTGDITFSGSAKLDGPATKDGDGNIISSTYLKLNRGTMTGGITLSNGAVLNGNVIGNLTGNASNDSDGNPINTTYLKRAGGEMTGDIVLNSNALKVLTNDNFYDKYYLPDPSPTQVVITEQEFNNNKTNYYTYDGSVYTQCTDEDIYDLTTTYYEYIDVNYNLLTTKNLVTVIQGGTGANNTTAARANLEVGKQINTASLGSGGTVKTTVDVNNYRLFRSYALSSDVYYIWYGLRVGSNIYFHGFFCNTSYEYNTRNACTIGTNSSGEQVINAGTTRCYRSADYRSDITPPVGIIFGIA